MEKQRISRTDVNVGEPLRWDVYDDHGALLLNRGHVIETAHQIDELIERGLFVESQHAPVKVTHAPAKVKDLPSVVRFLNLSGKRLERLLFGLHLEEDAPFKLLEAAKTVVYAVNLNPDIALGYIMLNREVDSYTIRHSIDTAIVSLRVGEVMKKPAAEIASMVAAALTMNLGMLRQHNTFQSKADPLNDREAEAVRQHPEESVRLLKEAGVTDAEWLSCVLHHHENEDGSGYPFGKTGQDYPQNAKIISLADRYCAGVTGRNYRDALLPSAALRGMFVESRQTVDAHLAPYFIQELGLYPPGTSVRLHNGEIAVVTRKGKTPTTPVVHAYIGPRGVPLSFPIQRDTAKALYAVQNAVPSEEAPLPFNMQQLWGSEAAL